MNHFQFTAGRGMIWQMRTRILLLLLVLLAFARLLYHVDFNTMWWDESLSLVRAELDWISLLRGDMRFSTGLFAAFTPDQHPFLYFVFLKTSIALFGKSEFALRYVSIMFSTLIVPLLWAFGRLLERRRFALPPTAQIAATLAAFHPFYLWYGQEVRHYALWSMLAILCTYALLRWLELEEINAPREKRRRQQIRYVVTLALFLSTHYYSVLLLPVHVLVIFLYYARLNLRRTLIVTLPLFLVGASGFAYITYGILSVGGAADNNARITPRVLLPDLLNSYSLGPTSNIAKLGWIVAIFAVLAVLGSIYMIRNRTLIQQGGWIVPLSVVSPPAFILLIALVIPPYQTSRHLALVSGLFIAVVAGGLALFWQRWRSVFASGLLLLMLSGMLYSSYIYYSQPQDRFSDLRSMGHTIHFRMLPGDLLLLYPPEYFRSFQYYLPLDQIPPSPDAISTTGQINTAWAVAPIGVAADANKPLDKWLAETTQQYRRVWLADGGTILLQDPGKQVLTWAREHLFLFNQYGYESVASDLDLYLFYPAPPTITDTTFIPPNPLHITIAEAPNSEIELRGYEFGRPMHESFAFPVTLYWQAIVKPQQRYHYILDLVELGADGSATVLSRTEREPFDGGAPTIWWDPGQFIVEESDVGAGLPALQPGSNYQLRLQIYREDTLEKQLLLITSGNALQIDPVTVALPISLP